MVAGLRNEQVFGMVHLLASSKVGCSSNDVWSVVLISKSRCSEIVLKSLSDRPGIAYYFKIGPVILQCTVAQVFMVIGVVSLRKIILQFLKSVVVRIRAGWPAAVYNAAVYPGDWSAAVYPAVYPQPQENTFAAGCFSWNLSRQH